MQTGVRFFGLAKTNYIIAKHADTRRLGFSIVPDCSFVAVLILDRAWPVWSECEMTCFCYITGTTIVILFTNTTLYRLGIHAGELIVEKAIFHWLHFDYNC